MTAIQKDKKRKISVGTKRQNKQNAVYEKAGLPKITLFPATEFHQPLQNIVHYITAKIYKLRFL